LYPSSQHFSASADAFLVATTNHSSSVLQLSVFRRIVLRYNPPGICSAEIQHLEFSNYSVSVRDVELTDDTGNPAKTAKQDVNQKVTAASRLQEHGKEGKQYCD
jgi:hypothetical protein